MPRTVHVSLNDEIYTRLKRIAEERGVTVTNLIRIILFNALKKIEEGEEDLLEVDFTPARSRRRARSEERGEEEARQRLDTDKVLEKLLEIHDAITRMKEEFEERLLDLEFKIDMLKQEVNRIKAKVTQLEDAYEDLIHPVHVEQVAPARR